MTSASPTLWGRCVFSFFLFAFVIMPRQVFFPSFVTYFFLSTLLPSPLPNTFVPKISLSHRTFHRICCFPSSLACFSRSLCRRISFPFVLFSPVRNLLKDGVGNRESDKDKDEIGLAATQQSQFTQGDSRGVTGGLCLNEARRGGSSFYWHFFV